MMLDKSSRKYRLAHNLWSKGKGHLWGAIEIEKASRSYAEANEIPDIEQFIFSGKFSVSLHLLLGFASELLTKSAFIVSGGDPDFVRKHENGHDLIRLLDAAEERGFSAPDPHTREVFQHLREPHLNHQFRYGEQAEVAMPDLIHTIPALQLLCDEVQDILKALA